MTQRHKECQRRTGLALQLVSLNHPQLSPYGSAHYISLIRVWRRTLNCMLYSYYSLQIVHRLFIFLSKLVRGMESIQIVHNIYKRKSVLQIIVNEPSKYCSLRLAFICYEKILLQMLKKYNRSRLNSQCDHLTTL